MKIITNTILSVSIFLLSVSVNFDALAAERYKVFEFGESGQTVSFLMTKKEIEEEDARLSKLKLLRESRKQKVEKWVQVFEFAESGNTVEFPMAKKEVEEAKILKKRLKEIPRKRVNKDVEIFEMADGHIITFEK